MTRVFNISKMKRIIHNVIQRIKSMREGRSETTYQLCFDDSGLQLHWLTMENDVGEDSIRWQDIVAAKVFKRDLFSHDCVCMAFQETNGEWFEINEDAKGWSDLLPELPRFLGGCVPHGEWLNKVTFPAFAPNETEIYRRKV